ncbi:MAG: hypothetical protein IJI41_12505 [Anaerolineaceae bacterium]|nr:hypothetical protein [Anaerolineaceae bacterium]
MAECDQRTWHYSNGDSCPVSKEEYYVLTSMSDRACDRKDPVYDNAAYIEEKKDQSFTEKGQGSNDDGALEKYFEDLTITGRNPRLILEIKELLDFVSRHLTDFEMRTICRLAIMEALPDKEVMQQLGIAKQSTYAYKKKTMLKKLVAIGKKIPEYRGFWIPTPKEIYKPPRRNDQN